ncbi:MAG: Hpt domain-containing protein, partial [Rhodomicrobium sp.]
MDDLLSDFLSETKEHIEGIETYLVLFEQNPHDSDAVTHIFRLVHTIKGTAGFLGLVRLQTISHAAETLIDTLRNGAPPTATAVSLLLQAMDRIKHLVTKVGELEQEPEGNDQDVIDRIDAYLRGEQDAASAPPEESKPEPAERPKAKPRAAKAKRAKEEPAASENAGAPVSGESKRPAPAQPAEAEQKAKEPQPAQPPEAEKKRKEPEPASAKDKTPDTIR